MAKPPNPELARKILDIARSELATKPPAEVNMRRIAELAGVSPTAIYYYYKSKAELFSTLKFEAVDGLVARIRAEAEKADDAVGRLRVLMGVFLAWCGENPYVARLLMEEEPTELDLEPERLRRYYAVSDLAKEYLEEAKAEGSLSTLDAELDVSVAQAALWGVFVQFAGKRAYPRFWDSIDPLAGRFTEVFLRALKKEKAE
jgi:TetR/AcrR family transcriptional regulator